MGGLVVQLYLQQARLPRAVLLCSIPVRGIMPFLLRRLRQHPLATLHGLFSFSPYALIGTPNLAREAFFRDTIPTLELDTYFQQISQESVRVALESAFTTRPEPTRNQTPLLVIAAEHDRVFTLAEQQSLANDYHSELLVVPGASHDLMLDPAWKQAADAIERFVTRGTLDQ
jgi:pimeloyl-ACP methyl ester carboxylesterase